MKNSTDRNDHRENYAQTFNNFSFNYTICGDPKCTSRPDHQNLSSFSALL